MSKLMFSLLGASALAAVTSLGSRVILADTLTDSASSSSSSSSAFVDCDAAAPSVPVIWPPDHTMVPETIVGVTDSAGLPITISVVRIQQDEPVEAPGSGNTEPDGSGLLTPTAYVRAERAGPGTGRIYVITFTATDTLGAECISKVYPYVPHDQGQGFTPVDTGQRYESTAVVD